MANRHHQHHSNPSPRSRGLTGEVIVALAGMCVAGLLAFGYMQATITAQGKEIDKLESRYRQDIEQTRKDIEYLRDRIDAAIAGVRP